MVKEIMEAKIVAAQEEVQKLVELLALIESEKQAAYDEGYAKGMADASGSDKLYSQAELDAKIQDAILPLQEQINVLNSQVVDVEAVKAEAKAELKAELKAKYEEQQVAESSSETGFSDLLS